MKRIAAVQKIGAKVVASSAIFFLAACVSNPISGLFGGGKEKGDQANAPDADERISILALENTLEADPRYAGQPINVPPSYKNISWPQPGGEADHTLHHLSAPLEFQKLWKVDVGAASQRRSRLTSPPVIADGKVYVVDAEAKVTAYNAADGSELWRTQLTPDVKEKFRMRELLTRAKASEIGFGGGVAYDSGQVFVTSGFGFVAALDGTSGEQIWTYKATAPVRTPPTAYRGAIYFVTNLNEFVALDAATGERQWNFQSFEEPARILSSASPAAAGDLVVAPFSSGELVAFLAGSGRAVWNDTLARNTSLTALSSLNDIAGSPVIDRGLVYVVSHAGRLAAIDIRTGERVWEAPIASLQMPWVAGEYIFLVSVDGELVAINRTDGAILWVSELRRYKKAKKRKGRIAWAGPVLAGDHLILVSTLGEMIKVSPIDGSVVETVKLEGGSVVSPIVADETIYILTEEGKLLAYK